MIKGGGDALIKGLSCSSTFFFFFFHQIFISQIKFFFFNKDKQHEWDLINRRKENITLDLVHSHKKSIFWVWEKLNFLSFLQNISDTQKRLTCTHLASIYGSFVREAFHFLAWLPCKWALLC